LSGAEFQGADLEGVEIWLTSFPDSILEQSPAPIGLHETSPLTPDDRAKLKELLRNSVGDGQLLERYPILRDDAPYWADEGKWTRYIYTTEPSPHALAQYLAGLACNDSETAEGLARRAMAYGNPRRGHYAKRLAEALLNLNCKGAKRLSDYTRASLQDFSRLMSIAMGWD
jgi:hypothetical protein